jgi:hypothetical protein
MSESMIAPTTVPQTWPKPPLRAVPPMMTAAIASSSHRMPVEPDAEPSRGTYRITAMATHTPWMT